MKLPIRLPFREDSVFGLIVLTLIVVPLIFLLPAYENFETVKFASLLALVGASVIVFFLRKENAVRFHTVFSSLMALLWAWVFTSFFFSIDKTVSLFGYYPRYTSGVVFFSVWFLFVVLCICVLDRAKWKAALDALLASSFVVSLVALLQAYGIILYLGPNPATFLQAPSTLGNPNFVSMFLVGTLPLAVYFCIQSRRWVSRIWYGVLIFLHIATFAVLTSRGALLAVGMVCLAALVFSVVGKLGQRYVWTWLAVSMCSFLLAAAGLGFNRPGSVTQTVQLNESNVVTRLYAWDTARMAMQEHPLVGTGPGTFQFYYEQHRGKPMAGELDLFDDAHNLFLQIGATSGIPAALLFIGLIGCGVWLGYKQLRTEPNPASAAALSGIVGLSVAASFNPVTIPSFVLLAVLLAGLVSAASKSFVLKRNAITAIVGTLVGAVAIVWGGVVLSSELFFYQGFHAYLSGDYSKAYRLTSIATRVNPFNQMYRVYRIGSDIQLGANPNTVEHYVNSMISLHPVSAVSYDRASNLYYLEFSKHRTLPLWEQANESLDRAISIDQIKAYRYWRKAVYSFDINELEDAKNSVKASLALHENQKGAWILLAKIYQLQEKRDQLVYSLNKVYELYPTDSRLKQLLGIAKSETDLSKIPLQITIDIGRLE